MALAHAIANKAEAEAAYRRGDLFDKRRKLMDAWAVFCATTKTEKAVAKGFIEMARVGASAR